MKKKKIFLHKTLLIPGNIFSPKQENTAKMNCLLLKIITAIKFQFPSIFIYNFLEGQKGKTLTNKQANKIPCKREKQIPLGDMVTYREKFLQLLTLESLEHQFMVLSNKSLYGLKGRNNKALSLYSPHITTSKNVSPRVLSTKPTVTNIRGGRYHKFLQIGNHFPLSSTSKTKNGF